MKYQCIWVLIEPWLHPTVIGSLLLAPPPPAPPFPTLCGSQQDRHANAHGRRRRQLYLSCEVESHRVFSQRAWAQSAAERGRKAVVVLKQVSVRCGGAVTIRPPPCGSLVRSNTKTSCTRLMQSRSLSPAGCPRAATMNKCPMQWSRYVKCVNIRCLTVKRPLFGDRTTRRGRPIVKTLREF